MSVGERLRRARLDAGKTLRQVAAETKIQLWILESIERDDFSRVPGGVFIRGYLTAISHAVGVAPSEVLSAYVPEAPPSPAAPPSPTPPPDLNERPATPLWQYVVIVAMVLLAVVLWRNMTRPDADGSAVRTSTATTPAPARPPSAASAQAPATPPPAEPGATATTGATLPSGSVEPNDGTASTPTPLVVQLHTNDEVWIEASADGERKAYRLFEGGQDLRLEAQKEIRLLVGDAGAVTYTINGRPGRPLGGTGVVRQFVVSPGTVESLTGINQGTDG